MMTLGSYRAALHYVIYNIGFFCAHTFSKHIKAIILSDYSDRSFYKTVNDSQVISLNIHTVYNKV